MSATEAREILERTVALIGTHGWIQGTMGNHKTGFCLLGAIDSVAFGPRTDLEFFSDEGRLLAVNAMRVHLGGRLVGWNDWPGRSKEEVVEALRAVAEKLGSSISDAGGSPEPLPSD